VHTDGFSQNFTDCEALSTYNETQAFKACAASTGDAGACALNPGISCTGNQVCTVGASTCLCWRYDAKPGGIGMWSGACGCISNSAPVSWN
jgi:hypothetical protein